MWRDTTSCGRRCWRRCLPGGVEILAFPVAGWFGLGRRRWCIVVNGGIRWQRFPSFRAVVAWAEKTFTLQGV